MSNPDPFAACEAEEAERRKASYNRDAEAVRTKSAAENAKHAAGISVYTSEEIAAHEAEAEDEDD